MQQEAERFLSRRERPIGAQHMNRTMQTWKAIESLEIRVQSSLSTKLLLSPILIPYQLSDI